MTDLGPIAAAGYPSPPDNHYSPQNPSVSSLYERTSAMASSSVSPSAGSSGAYAGGGSDKSPLSSLNLGFLKSLTDKRTTRDGNPPKRRGPKPDSKPALTRRQELNRQAQRTHRERKELYIKALEDEVLRLKEIYSNISQDKERLAEENRQLKALLAQSGMSMSSTVLGGGSSILDDSISNPASAGYGSSASVSGTHSYGAGGAAGGAPSSLTSAYTTSPGGGGAMRGMSPGGMSQGHSHSHGHGHSHSQMAGQQHAGGSAPGPQRNPGVDYDQAGIDFVLTLEKPCMDHLPWLLERGTETGGAEPCGHALMASCPPEPFPELTTDIPFGYGNVRTGDAAHDNSGQRTWELSKADLATLLDLSKRLNLDGEITPVMAWGMVLAHPRLGELTTADFVRLTEELGSKMRCYGFGAVMEEFEVRDALENVFSTKPEPLSAMAY